MKKKKVIVTGGRDYNDFAMISDTLDLINPDIVVQGGAKGADLQARYWASLAKKEVITYEADWSQGKKAGPLRNKKMVEEHCDADVLVAFPGGAGTKNCVKNGVANNLLILMVHE